MRLILSSLLQQFTCIGNKPITDGDGKPEKMINPALLGTGITFNISTVYTYTDEWQILKCDEVFYSVKTKTHRLFVKEKMFVLVQ